jgi:hydrogenase/urease accessory protein HupE
MKRLLAGVLCWCWAALSMAHPVAQGRLDVQWRGQVVTLAVRVSDEQIMVASTRISPQADSLQDLWADHGRYLLARLQLHAGSQRLAGELLDVQRATGNFVEYRLRYQVPEQAAELRLSQDLLNEIEYAPGNPWEVSFVVNAHTDGTASEALLLRSHNQALSIGRMQSTGTGTLAWQFLQHGFAHILAGIDHLLFIGALVLAVVSLRSLVMVVAAFTLAHSITLTLSVLQLVRLPSAIVEPMIAGSIVAVAVYNIFWPRSGSSRLRLATAFFFGLFHGLGFAGGLVDAAQSMPGDTVAVAIAAFSAGVECGHMLVVLPLFLVLQALRRRSPADAGQGELSLLTLRSGSALICVAGAFYLFNALQW